MTVDNGIQFVMLVVVGWYAWQTQLMQKAMVAQTKVQADQAKLQTRLLELQLKPVLEVDVDYDKDDRTLLVVTNKGNGVAINVKIDPIVLAPEGKGPDGADVRLEFDSVIPVLPPGKTENLAATPFFSTRAMDPKFPWGANLEAKYSGATYPVTLRFLDVEAKSREQTVLLGLGKRQVVS